MSKIMIFMLIVLKLIIGITIYATIFIWIDLVLLWAAILLFITGLIVKLMDSASGGYSGPYTEPGVYVLKSTILFNFLWK